MSRSSTGSNTGTGSLWVSVKDESVSYFKKNNFVFLKLLTPFTLFFFFFFSLFFSFLLLFFRYVIDGNGKIGYKGELGPDGYKPEECRAWLEENMGKK